MIFNTVALSRCLKVRLTHPPLLNRLMLKLRALHSGALLNAVYRPGRCSCALAMRRRRSRRLLLTGRDDSKRLVAFTISEGYHDCNDMLQRGADVRSWLFSGLSSFASAVRPGEELEHLRREIPPCAVCGAMMDGYYGGKWLCARHWDEARKVQP